MRIIKPSAEPSNEGPAEYFTGTVRVTPLVKGENPSCLTCASVGLQPGDAIRLAYASEGTASDCYGRFRSHTKSGVSPFAESQSGCYIDSSAREALAWGVTRKRHDPLWSAEYESFVDAVSFALPGEEIGFAAALDATRDLVAVILE